MKKAVQTPEAVRDLFLIVYGNFLPELSRLDSYPFLFSVGDEKLVWIWQVSEKKVLSYFGGKFRILDKIPAENSTFVTMSYGNSSKDLGAAESFSWKKYLAEYDSPDTNKRVQNMVLELTSGSETEKFLSFLFNRGICFQFFEEDEIEELSLAEHFCLTDEFNR